MYLGSRKNYDLDFSEELPPQIQPVWRNEKVIALVYRKSTVVYSCFGFKNCDNWSSAKRVDLSFAIFLSVRCRSMCPSFIIRTHSDLLEYVSLKSIYAVLCEVTWDEIRWVVRWDEVVSSFIFITYIFQLYLNMLSFSIAARLLVVFNQFCRLNELSEFKP